jgi:hypothetical protein
MVRLPKGADQTGAKPLGAYETQLTHYSPVLP